MTTGNTTDPSKPDGRLKRLVAGGTSVWKKVSARPGAAHLIRAGGRFTDRLGSQFGAAITYFSFLSMVPILMVAFSIAGFVLHARPDLLDSLKREVTVVVPGDLATSIGHLIDGAVAQRLTVGIIGLVVAAYSGVSWMGNLRQAVRAMWRPVWDRAKDPKENFLLVYLKDLGSLAGLGIAVLATFSLSAIGGAAQDLVVGWLGLAQYSWLTPVLTVVPILVAMAADVLIFAWVYTILPFKQYRADRRTLLIGSLIAAIGFEILKALLTQLVARVTSSPTGAVFGSVIGLLFFFNLVAQLFLFVAAWIATADNLPDEGAAA